MYIFQLWAYEKISFRDHVRLWSIIRNTSYVIVNLPDHSNNNKKKKSGKRSESTLGYGGVKRSENFHPKKWIIKLGKMTKQIILWRWISTKYKQQIKKDNQQELELQIRTSATFGLLVTSYSRLPPPEVWPGQGWQWKPVVLLPEGTDLIWSKRPRGIISISSKFSKKQMGKPTGLIAWGCFSH